MEFKIPKDGNGILLRTYLKRLSFSNKLVAHLKTVENGITVNGDAELARLKEDFTG